MSRTTKPLIQVDAQGRPLSSSENWTTFRGSYTGLNLIYAGFARPGASEDEAVWQLSKMTYDGTGNLTKIEWPVNAAGGVSTDFEFIWTDILTYTYA